MKVFRLFLINSQDMNKKYLPILSVNFIGVLGYSIVLPILIYLVEKMGGNAWMYGLMGSVYPAFQLIGSPWLGRLSDQIGRKRVLLLSQAGTFGAWLLFIFALYLPTDVILWQSNSNTAEVVTLTLPLLLLFVARALDGFTGGNISVANAYMADISTEEDRNENFGKMSAAMSLAFVLGPALAGVLSTTSLQELLPVLIAATISLVTLLMIQGWLRETNPCLERVNEKNRLSSRFFGLAHNDCSTQMVSKVSLKDLLQVKDLSLMLFLYFLIFLSFSLFYAGFPIYASNVLGWTARELGGYLAISSVIMFVVNTYGIKILNRWTSTRNLILFGSLFLAVSYLLLPFQNTFALVLANIFLSVGNGIMWPSFLANLTAKSPKPLIGSVMGWGNSMGSMGSILGLIVGGYLFGLIQAKVFFIGGVLFLLFTIVVLLFFKPAKSASIELAKSP